MKFKELLSESYYYDKTGILFNGETIETMSKFDNNSVDMILADLPYGTTQCKWDIIIPFDKLWEQYKRIIKKDGAIVLTSSQPFTSLLISSNIEMFKYCWIWEKDNASNFFAAKFQPLNNTEDVCVFSTGGANNGTKNPIPYFPQGIEKVEFTHVNGKNVGGLIGKAHKTSMTEGKEYVQNQTGYPFKTLKYKRDSNKVHPTQKPISLFEYLIRTYTKEGDIVLDNTSGSGTTAISSQNTKRKWICIEKEVQYCAITKERVIENKSE